jgi:hypothetical protein
MLSSRRGQVSESAEIRAEVQTGDVGGEYF